MSESNPNETTLYFISEEDPNILRCFDNEQEAQKAFELVRDALKGSDNYWKYKLFAVNLTKTYPD